MDLKEQIKQYIETNGNGTNHVFANGTQVVGISLKQFLGNWYVQAVEEYHKEGTTQNADAIKKMLEKSNPQK